MTHPCLIPDGQVIIFNFPAGHIADNRAFYIGKQAKLEFIGDKATLQYT